MGLHWPLAAVLMRRVFLMRELIRAIRSIRGVRTSPVRHRPFRGGPEEVERILTEFYKSPASQVYYQQLEAKGPEQDWQDMVRRTDFEKLCSSASSILDMGCGTGNLAVAIATRYPSTSVWGVDIGKTADSLAKAKLDKGLKNLNFKSGNLLKTGFSDGMFDLIVSRFVIEHVVYPFDMVKEAYRLLRPGGVFYLVYPHLLINASASAMWTEFVSLFSRGPAITYIEPVLSCPLGGDADAAWLCDSIKVLRMLRSAGFRVVTSKPMQSMIEAQRPQ